MEGYLAYSNLSLNPVTGVCIPVGEVTIGGTLIGEGEGSSLFSSSKDIEDKVSEAEGKVSEGEDKDLEGEGKVSKCVEGKSPEGVEGKDLEGVEGKDPEGIEGKDPEGIEGKDPEGIEGIEGIEQRKCRELE